MKKALNRTLITLLFFLVVGAGFHVLMISNQDLKKRAKDFYTTRGEIQALPRYEDVPDEPVIRCMTCERCGMSVPYDMVYEHAKNCTWRER